MKIQKLFLVLICLAQITLGFSEEKPTVKKPFNENPKSLLMIGNSFMYYNNGVHNPLLRLIRADNKLGKEHKIRSITINGSSLSWHDVDSYINNTNIGSFSINSKNELSKYKFSGYEMAIMQDCSQCPIHPLRQDLFHEYVAEHSKVLKQKGVEPALMMTWAYKDKPEMTEELAYQYTSAGNNNNLLVIPVGLAFAESMKTNPEIDLYTSDKRHPSKAGTYLSACMIFASIFQSSPVGNNFIFDLDKEVAMNLQKNAWNTYKKYYKK